MKTIFSRIYLSAAIVAAACLVGCAGPAPNYAPSIDNVEALKKTNGRAMKTGAISVAPGMQGAQSISLRGSTMVSPVGGHYGDYLAEALRQELELAKLHNRQSDIEITGTLLKNDMNAAGVSTGVGQMEARFIVKVRQEVRFDKVKRVEHQWESSFAGAVAVPLATQNYPVMVQKLVGLLVRDPDFVKAIRNP